MDFSNFDAGNHLAGLSYQRHRRLEFNPETGQWEDSSLSDQGYDQKYAANSARGAFKTFGTVQATGPDTSTEAERSALSPIGSPEFYGGSGGGMGGAALGGPLEGLRAALEAARRKQQAQDEEDRRAYEKKQRGY